MTTKPKHTVDLAANIPLELADDFLGKLHYVSEAMLDFELDPATRKRVFFRLKEGNEDRAPQVAERIKEVAKKMCAAYRPQEPKVICNQLNRPVSFKEDPQPLLEKLGQLHRYGAGRIGLGPRVNKLMEYFDSEVKKMAGELSAEFYQFPSLVGGDVLDRAHYLKSFPHALTLVTHLREDLDAIQNYARHVRWNGRALDSDKESLSEIRCLLSPTVCFHCYGWLQNTTQAKPLAISALGKCFRYEAGNLGGLERLWDFTMREIIFVGSKDYVLSQRQKTIESSVKLLDAWGLAYEIKTASDPFFIEDFAAQTSFQSAFDLKFEVRAMLPYAGKTLAIGSFNYHQDFFGRSLNIQNSQGEPIHTSCVGFGFERLALAFFAQHGLDPAAWPKQVAKAVR